MAVGDHLLLGGDNMDAALAHYLENKLKQKGHPALDSGQWLQLLAEARAAKEALLSPEVQREISYPVVIQGTGSSVVKGSLAAEISCQEIESILSEGFFGRYDLQEALKMKPSRGFRTMGLPYEDEPSITRHLAHFLQQARYLDRPDGIHYLLFNGGTLKPEIFQQALEQSLKDWFPQTPLQRLSSASLDLAVARGAAYYGKARRGFGVSIGGGLPRTYYLKIEVKEGDGKTKPQALTLLPRGSRKGGNSIPCKSFRCGPIRRSLFIY